MATRTSTSPAADPASARAVARSIPFVWWLVAGWVALVALHLWVARGVTGPLVLQDETGYLGNARWLAGLNPVPEMGEEPVYAWGYSLLLTPLVALVDDPAVLYRAVQVLNSMLLASLFPLLWVALRRVGGVEAHTAAAAAAVGSVFPATLVHSSVAWAESVLPVVMVLFVLATWAALTERPVWQRVLVAPVAVFAYAAHPRLLPALVLVVVGLGAAAATRRVPRSVAAVGVGLAAVGWLVIRRVDAALLDARWPDRVADEGSATRLLRRLVNPTNWPEVVAGSVGQAWYLAAGSLGLAAVGALAGVWWVRRGGGLRDPRRLTVAFTAVVMLALFVTSVVSFVGTAERVDHLVYGRYNEAWVPLLVATGAVALLAARGYQRTRLVAGAAGLTAVLGLLLWIGRGADAFEGETVWNNILGLRWVMEVVGQGWMVPAATALAVVALAALWAAVRRPFLGVALAGAALVVSGLVAVGPLTDFARVRYEGWALPDQLARVVSTADVDAVGLERERSGLMAVLGYPFWSPDLTFRFTDRWDRPDPAGLVVSSVDDPDLDASGAAIVGLDARNGQAVWVLAGTDAFDRLASVGALLPRGFPSALAPAAQVADVEFVAGRGHAVVEVDGDQVATRTELAIASGESSTIALRVTHAGTGQAWPSDVEYPLPGVVRLGARWYDEAGTVVQSADRGHLPGPMWPGDQVVVHLELRAVDAVGGPLAPGRYVLGIDLLQAEVGWFADEGDETLRLTVEVY